MIEILHDNFSKLLEMTSYFVDETDPSIGKLYINYPMMESFRDCDSFFGLNYEFLETDIECLPFYKQIVSKKQLGKQHVYRFGRNQFVSLICQNTFKLNKIFTGIFKKPLYRNYCLFSNQTNLLKKEIDSIDFKRKLPVINTSLFF